MIDRALTVCRHLRSVRSYHYYGDFGDYTDLAEVDDRNFSANTGELNYALIGVAKMFISIRLVRYV